MAEEQQAEAIAEPEAPRVHYTTKDYRALVEKWIGSNDAWIVALSDEGKGIHPDLRRDLNVATALLMLFDKLDTHRDAISKIFKGGK